MKELFFYVFGPRVYKVQIDGPKIYTPRSSEIWGERLLAFLRLLWKFAIYTSPIIGIYFYKKDYFTPKNYMMLLSFVNNLGIVSSIAFSLRAYSRYKNPQYKNFMSLYEKANANHMDSQKLLRKFDYDFQYWPVDYVSKSNITPLKFNEKKNSSILTKALGQIAFHTFGLRLIYPGQVCVLTILFQDILLKGRMKLVDEYNGRRNKIKTYDHNTIDSMFIDRRGISSNGNVLVITSEGNAGFYEIGIMTTPIESGYSVLGYNHPGFANSSGRPYPLQERYAIDAVIQFAINKLNFSPQNIVLFGWSIGCYSIAWAAVQYPDIKGVILDATFDDILPLAVARMPKSWKPLVTEVIRQHVDLNIAKLLKNYSGPVKIIRRTKDEIICVIENNIATNRGNHLLIKILQDRYPKLIGQDQLGLLKNYLALNASSLPAFIASEHPGDMDKNKKVLFLIEKYLTDFDSTHCTTLPPQYFHIPREIILDEDFVFT